MSDSAGVFCFTCNERLLWCPVKGIWVGQQVPALALSIKGHVGHVVGLAEARKGAVVWHAIDGGVLVGDGVVRAPGEC